MVLSTARCFWCLALPLEALHAEDRQLIEDRAAAMQSALVSSPLVARPRFGVAQLPKAGRPSRTGVVTQAAAIAAEDVPDMSKRVSVRPRPSSSPAADLADSR